MKKIVFLLLICATSFAQEVYSNPASSLSDYKGFLLCDTFKLKVSGFPNIINKDFGLAKVCFNIEHSKVSDLKIELRSPDGTTIWLTNRNGRDEGSNYTSTCFRSNGFNGYIHEGQAPFQGEYIPDGRIEFLNNGQDPNGDWILLVHDLAYENTGKLHNWSLSFEDNPTPNYFQSPCNVENSENCFCDDLSKNCLLLPDLVILESFTKNQIKEYPYNHYKYPNQLRLATTIANIGIGPMHTFGKNEWYCGDSMVSASIICPDGSFSRQKLYQRLYKLEGKNLSNLDTLAGTNYYDDKPGHNHFHVDDWVVFSLIKEKKGKRKIVAQGEKVSYCLFDTGICQASDSLCLVGGINYSSKNLKNYGLGNFSDCNSGVQGISVGGYDTYGMMYEGQFIELPKKVRNGEYILEITVDPNQIYLELDKDNNTFRMPVTLSKRKK